MAKSRRKLSRDRTHRIRTDEAIEVMSHACLYVNGLLLLETATFFYFVNLFCLSTNIIATGAQFRFFTNRIQIMCNSHRQPDRALPCKV